MSSVNLSSLAGLGAANTASLVSGVIVPDSSAGASLFGDATLLSLGTSTANDATYSALTNILATAFDPSNQTAAPAPQQTSKAEAAALEKAFTFLEEGNIDEARTTLNGILSKNRQSGAAIQALGLIKLSEGDAQGAAQLFQRADFFAPGRGYDQDAENAVVLQQDDAAVLERATQLVSSKDQRSKGIELLFRLTDRSPENAEAQLLLGKSLLAKNQVADGISRVLYAIDYGDESLIRGVKDEFEKLTTLAPKIAEYRGVLARTRVKLGEYEAALNDLGIADDLVGEGDYFRDDRIAATVGIGREQLAEGNIALAVKTLREARALNPDSDVANVALAEALLAKGEQSRSYGNLKAGIQAYEEASRVLGKGGGEGLRRRLAGRAYEAGVRYQAESRALGRDADLEVVAFQAAYNVDPENAAYKRRLADTRNTIGDQYLAAGKFEAAAGAYQRAYDLYKSDETFKSNLVGAWSARGDELLTQKRYSDAIAAHQKAYSVDKSNGVVKAALANAYNERGLDYQSKSKFSTAVLDFKEALRLQPGNTDYQANYDFLRGYDF